MIEKKRIIVTGGAGFVGSNLIKRLLADGNAVVCVDSLYSGKYANIAAYRWHPDFSFIRHDIAKPFCYDVGHIDEIYNLACPASPQQYQFDPVSTLDTAVNGTRNMLDLARRHGARLLQASTSEVYGDPLEHPQRESYFGNVDCLGKRSCYDEGKRAGESLCKDYYEQYGVDARIVRLFNIYGPNMMFNDGRVISNFLLQAMNGDEISIHGTGEQSRSFMYVDDLIDAFIMLMAVPKETCGYGPYNIGNPEERSIRQLAEDILTIVGSKSKLSFQPYETIPGRLGDPQRRCPDIGRIRALTGWQPRVSFEEGLKMTYDDFRARIADKTRVLVICPSFFPIEGPAEQAVREIGQRLGHYELDVVTARLRPDLPREEKIGSVSVCRVGWGTSLDKFLLPIMGTWRALRLHKKRDYQLAWGIMASYGSLATMLFSFFARRAFMISLFEGKAMTDRMIKRRFLRPFYRLMIGRSHRLQLVANLEQSQLSWLGEKDGVQAIDLARGWDYAAKKTKEEFQQLEIRSARM